MDDPASSATTVERLPRRLASTSIWAGYIATVAATVSVLCLAYGGALVALKRAGALPPPAIVNEVCADQKLEWLRADRPIDPNLLVVGSSIAWRDVDSAQFVRQQPLDRPLNGGFCHATINQTAFVTKYLLGHLSSIHSIVAVVVPQDFTDCTHTPSQLFDPATANGYVFDQGWPYRFYMSQFDLVSLVRNASEIRAMRDGRNVFDSLMMSKYGDGPLSTTAHRGLTYGAIGGYDPACFASLHDLAVTVAAGGQHLFVATGPLNPEWSARYDKSGRLRDALAAGIAASLRGVNGAKFWDGDKAFAERPSDFVDAIHINWDAAHRYSAQLADALDHAFPAATADRANRL